MSTEKSPVGRRSHEVNDDLEPIETNLNLSLAEAARGHRTRWITLFFAVWAIAVSAWVAIKYISTSPVTPPQRTSVAPPLRLVLPGRVEPVCGLLHLSFDTSGTITHLHVAEGDQVEEGTLVAELRNDDLRSRLAAVEATHTRAVARHLMLTNGPRREEIEEAAAEVRVLEAEHAADTDTLATRTNLAKQQVVTREELRQVTHQVEESRQRLTAARARLQRLKAGTRIEELQMAQAEIDATEHQTAELKAQIDRTELRTPQAGKVLRLYLRAGETVDPLHPQPIAQLANLSRMQVRAEVEESLISEVAVGMPVQIRSRDTKQVLGHGVITRRLGIMGRKQLFTHEHLDKRDLNVEEIVIDTYEPLTATLNLRVDVEIDRKK